MSNLSLSSYSVSSDSGRDVFDHEHLWATERGTAGAETVKLPLRLPNTLLGRTTGDSVGSAATERQFLRT